MDGLIDGLIAVFLYLPAAHSGGFGAGPARHRLRLQRQEQLHDALRVDVS